MENSNARASKKHPEISVRLLRYLEMIPDPRGDRGKRYSIEQVLALLLTGLSAGLTTLSAVYEWASGKRIYPLLQKTLGLVHGIPDPTTMSRILQRLNPRQVIAVMRAWFRQRPGEKNQEKAYSLDGKTMNGVHSTSFRHILSLYGHYTSETLDQEAVSHKENEITASGRLLNRNRSGLEGKIITADALLTQKSVIDHIKACGAFYVLKVKANNRQLLSVIKTEFQYPHAHHQRYTVNSTNHGRDEATTIELTDDFDDEFLQAEGWLDIRWVGKLTKVGLRPQKQQGRAQTTRVPVYEESYFISSCQTLTPAQAHQLIRGHWSIENKLHRQKDVLLREDEHTLRKHNSPQVLTYLRSMLLTLLESHPHPNKAQLTRSFQFNPMSLFDFLRTAYIF